MAEAIVIDSTFGALFDKNLVGKIVECDVVTQVLTTDKAIRIVQDNKAPNTFRLLFPKEYEECYEELCSHSDKATECFTDVFQGYVFDRDKEVIVKEKTPDLFTDLCQPYKINKDNEVTPGVDKIQPKETKITEMTRPLHNPEHYGALMRETNRILPELFRKMIGNGGLSIDTDSMSLADPRDRHHLEWLARIAAGFVLAEQARWEPQLEEALTVVGEYKERTGDLERLLDSMREAAAKEDVTVEELKELIGKYRDPLENHYDKMRKEREKRAMLDELAKNITKPNPASDSPAES
jgi:hypothetical protein